MRQIAFALILTSTAALAQQQPSPQTAPTIPFDSVPDFLKLPPDVYLGEAAGVAVNSKGHVFVFSRGNNERSGLWRRRRRNCSNSTPTAISCARSAAISTPGRSPIPCASTRTTISGPSTRARTWSIKFNPEGRVVMVFGRKQEASDEAAEPLEASEPAAAAGRRHVPPGDRRGLGPEPATSTSATATSIRASPRSIKDGNWIKSWGELGTGPGQFNTPHSIASRRRRTTSMSATAATAASRCSTATAISCEIIQIDVPFDHARRAAGDRAETRRARRQSGELRRRR